MADRRVLKSYPSGKKLHEETVVKNVKVKASMMFTPFGKVGIDLSGRSAPCGICKYAAKIGAAEQPACSYSACSYCIDNLQKNEFFID